MYVRAIYCIVFFLSLLILPTLAHASPYVADEVIVVYESSAFSFFSSQSSSHFSVEVLSLDGETVSEAIARLSEEPDIAYVQPNYIYQAYSLPNDTFFGLQWALHNTGQTVGGFAGTAGADINWLSGMALFSGVADQSITGTLVAIIDDGVNYNHVDLTGQFWNGSNCLSYTGAVLGGCTVGYDLYDNDFDPLPYVSDHHGTHIAGIIGAKMNNSLGIVGTNPNVKIMALRAGSGNTLTTANIIKAVQFAQHNGARIINASFGGSAYDPALETAMQNFPGIIITAAGNGSIDGVGFEITGGNPIYPCAFNLSNSLCIAATDAADELTPYSNFSDQYVDLAAPCSRILGTYGTGQYAFASGTSSAVPFTVGIASLVWSMYPEATVDQVLDAIISGAVYLDVLEDKTIYPSRVDLYGSLLHITSLFSVDPFAFEAVTGALPLTWYESNEITLATSLVAPSIVVYNGEYRINSGTWTDATGTVDSGDALQVRILSPWEPDLTDEVIITVGAYSTSFAVTTMDAGLSGGESIMLSGGRYHNTTTGLDIVIEANSGLEYRVFGHRFVAEYTGVLLSGENSVSPVFDGTTGISYLGVVLGTGGSERYDTDYLIYDTAAPELSFFSITSGQTIYGTSVFVTGTVTDDFALDFVDGLDLDCDTSVADETSCTFSGTVVVESGDFTILLHLYDKAGNLDIVPFPVFVDTWDRTPNVLSFTAQSNITRSTLVESNTITIAGIDTGVNISIVGGQYKIGTGSYTSATGTVSSGDTIQLRLTSSSSYSTTSTAVLTVGRGSGSWSVSTESAPPSVGGGGGGGGGGGDVCNPVSVTNGTVNSSTCQITCSTGYTLSGSQCLVATTTTGAVQSGAVLTGNEDSILELFVSGSTTSSLSASALIVPAQTVCAPATELQQAYTFAYGLGVTTMSTLGQARMCDGVIRSELAKMVANYAIQIHGLTPDESRVCTFSDIADQSSEMQYYIRLVCQLGIMGVGLDAFEPSSTVDRAQWGTVLSRILYGNQHNNESPFYSNHLNALTSNGIITNNNPALLELRGYVMLMMMRAGD